MPQSDTQHNWSLFYVFKEEKATLTGWAKKDPQLEEQETFSL